MSDARWTDVDDAISEAAGYFAGAIRLRREGRFDASFEGQRDGMALMHFMQSGHTSAEVALSLLLDILDEDRPSGQDWHKRLIDRLAKPLLGEHARPAILPAEIAADLHETRSFRHRATRNYGHFDVTKAAQSFAAAERLVTALPAVVVEARSRLDPPQP